MTDLMEAVRAQYAGRISRKGRLAIAEAEAVAVSRPTVERLRKRAVSRPKDHSKAQRGRGFKGEGALRQPKTR